MADAPGEKTVYRYPWVAPALIAITLGSLAGVLTYKTSQSVIVTLLITAVVTVPGLGERRRKIEISDDEVTYWPSFFSPRKARFRDVISITRKDIAGGVNYVVSGLELELPNYETMQIPLDLYKRQEVSDKITEAWNRHRSLHLTAPRSNIDTASTRD